MDEVLLTWYQALQLLALGPCLFMVFFLCVTARHVSQIFVPALYFLSLACSFFLPLLDTLNLQSEVQGVLLLGESLTPSLSFLLIMQFIRGRIPAPFYWLILAIPLIGGSSIVYATLLAKGEICIRENICTEPSMFKQLYEIFSTSLTFLLTIVIYHRIAYGEEGNNTSERQNKYALILALIALNLAILAIDLAQISQYVALDRAQLAITIVRIGFIYLVLTSVFRVFDRSFAMEYDRIPHMRPVAPNERELALAEEIRTLMTRDKLYRSMDLSRKGLASKLAVSEHNLSRIINLCFEQNFNTLINSYRLAEAKERLANEATSITVIAFEVGFNSISSFNRVFKDVLGTSPTQYRSRKGK